MQKVKYDIGAGKVFHAGEGRVIPAGPFDMRIKVESAETGGAFALGE